MSDLWIFLFSYSLYLSNFLEEPTLEAGHPFVHLLYLPLSITQFKNSVTKVLEMETMLDIIRDKNNNKVLITFLYLNSEILLIDSQCNSNSGYMHLKISRVDHLDLTFLLISFHDIRAPQTYSYHQHPHGFLGFHPYHYSNIYFYQFHPRFARFASVLVLHYTLRGNKSRVRELSLNVIKLPKFRQTNLQQ